MTKSTSRLRRAKSTRLKIKRLAVPRLTVHRTPRHIYAQILSPSGAEVLVWASSLDKEFAAKKSKTSKKENVSGGIAMATKVGELIAKRGKTSGLSKIAFDRSGFKYHGRVKALAEAARSHGLEF
jgi:large subunit ribosomal protein L18